MEKGSTLVRVLRLGVDVEIEDSHIKAKEVQEKAALWQAHPSGVLYIESEYAPADLQNTAEYQETKVFTVGSKISGRVGADAASFDKGRLVNEHSYSLLPQQRCSRMS